MTKAIALVNGIKKMVDFTSSLPDIYDETIDIVVSSPVGNEIAGPISAGVDIALPLAQTYDHTSDQLEVYLNGQRLDAVYDYNQVSTTQIQMTFDLLVGDAIRLRIDRAP